jgi:hypothetical protein
MNRERKKEKKGGGEKKCEEVQSTNGVRRSLNI